MSTSNFIYSVAFAVIDAQTGVIRRTGECSLESLALQAGAGQLVADLPDGVSDDSHYWDGVAFTAYPERPGSWATWDGTQWIDARVPEDPQAVLAAQRARSSLTKMEFVMAVVGAGLISQASGIAMLDGVLPPEMDGMTDAMTDTDKFELAVKLKGANIIERLDPFIIAAGAHLGLTDEQIDAVFGIEFPT